MGIVAWFGAYFHSFSSLSFHKPLATTLPMFGTEDNPTFIWFQPIGQWP